VEPISLILGGLLSSSKLVGTMLLKAAPYILPALSQAGGAVAGGMQQKGGGAALGGPRAFTGGVGQNNLQGYLENVSYMGGGQGQPPPQQGGPDALEVQRYLASLLQNNRPTIPNYFA